ncbi:hypothetical protein GWJ07_20680 [Proteus sp. G2639]|uniref:hypothetical protein n=1 Tax=Proteus vulgaris TaxID=585 RepID=UPI001376BAE9|nr:hypothetical protein [Proteus sp. G2639]
MKKFDIDKIMSNLSDKDIKKINQTYNNQTNKEESFKKWFFDTFIFDRILFEGLFISLTIVFICIITSGSTPHLFYSFLVLVFIYFTMSLVITIYDCIKNKISLILFFRVKKIAVTTYIMKK